MADKITILWLYPDILNLHGDRGNLMALERIGGLLDLPVEVRRVDNLTDTLPLAEADLLVLTSGEVKNMPYVVDALRRERAALDDYVARGGYI